MKFIDEAVITVQAGNGGSGRKSFYREKFVPLGGPDGGDGGAGGSVILVADRNTGTLLDFHYRPRWQAQNGDKGGQKNCEGRSGEDLLVKVPVGTEVFRDGVGDKRAFITDLCQDGQQFILAKGGRGGKGNAFFKSPTNRAPEHFQPGEKGEAGTFLLSLKLIADVGIIGFPNAGKSTFISVVSSARPKVADYPFTTLTPNLGVAKLPGGRSCVLADIPGLIPGAHQGRGLGVKFLKHVERTRLLLHLIDPNQLNEQGQPIDPLDSWKQINEELRLFSPDLATKPQIVVLTKQDTVTAPQLQESSIAAFKEMGLPVLAISSVTGTGVQEVLSLLAAQLSQSAPQHL